MALQYFSIRSLTWNQFTPVFYLPFRLCAKLRGAAKLRAGHDVTRVQARLCLLHSCHCVGPNIFEAVGLKVASDDPGRLEHLMVQPQPSLIRQVDDLHVGLDRCRNLADSSPQVCGTPRPKALELTAAVRPWVQLMLLREQILDPVACYKPHFYPLTSSCSSCTCKTRGSREPFISTSTSEAKSFASATAGDTQEPSSKLQNFKRTSCPPSAPER